ncbi:MAG: hypothetical protein C0490_16525, partial [Marivirga sp.]|nr:hypothetical protein [Marivirga sp.]
KPVSNRETRFKTPFKKSNQKRRPASTKRVRSKERSVAGRANAASPRRRASGIDRPGKPLRPIVGSQPSTKQKAWRGDIAGYRIRSRTSPGSSRNVYPQYGRYTHNPSKKPKRTENAVSNRETLSVLKILQTPEKPPVKRRKVVPKSASRSFTARKSINVYAHFRRPKRKGEQATTKDLAGRPLRKRNFETPRAGVIAPTFKPYYHRKPMGDKPYGGKTLGGYRSATRAGEAWQGDVAGRKIRGRNFSSKKSIEGQPILPSRKNRDRYGDRAYRGKAGWYQTITRSGETRPGRGPLPARVPGMGADGIAKFQGKIRGGRPFKGGGSVSGRTWNNDGRALAVRTPQQGARAALFQGNIKSQRPLKGGGSVSGKLWNNNGQPLVARTPKQGARAALFQGNIKSKRPDKGGGSVSGRLWNNNETPVAGRTPPASARKISGYPGKMKRFEVQPGFGDQGESFTGYIKLKRFKKEYIQNPNASDESAKKRRPNKTAHQSAGLQVKVKRPGYVENKNSSEEALLKLKPSKNSYQAGELQVKVKQKEYGKKPHGAEGALPGLKPTRSSVKASEYARSVRRTWDYVHNPSSADEALKTREPGKAFARSAAYQGNIKMQKFTLFEKNRSLHPDTKFIKTNKNNVDEEKDAVTNFKLWWARLFKKQEAQPDHLKYKGKKPRYDKGEEGMW